MWKPSNYNYFVPVKMGRRGDYILCNTFARSIAIIPESLVKKTKKILRSCEVSKEDKNTKLLAENGFLVEEEIDELALIRSKFQELKYDPSRLILTIFSTGLCNFRCKYCYQGFREGKMSVPTIKKVLKFVETSTEKGTESIRIVWFGGEPLLAIDVMEKLTMGILKNPKVKFSAGIVTNGYLLSEDVCKHLIGDLKITTFQITLDGNAERHNIQRVLVNGKTTFKRVFTNVIRMIKSYHDTIKIIIRVNVSPDFSTSDLNFLSLLPSETNECSYIDIEPIHNNPDKGPSFGREDPQEVSKRIYFLRRKVKEMGFNVSMWFYNNRLLRCPAEIPNSYVIRSDGSIMICTGVDPIDKFVIGSLNTEGESKMFNPVKKHWSESDPFSIDECRKCKLLPICLGGCTFARVEKGTLPCMLEKYYTSDYLGLLV